MSCLIEKGNKIILECSVGVLEDFYYEFQNLIFKNELKTNLEFDNFMNKLNESMFTHGGATIDIESLFTSPDNLLLLIELTQKTITIIESSLKDYAVIAVHDFYDELVKYHEELILKNKQVSHL